MTEIVNAVSNLQKDLPIDHTYPGRLFAEGSQGCRVIALAVALANPNPEHMDLAIKAIGNARSPFEQFLALRLAKDTLDPSSLSQREQREELRAVLLDQKGVPIHDSDPSRARIKRDILSQLGRGPSKSTSKRIPSVPG